MTDRFALTLQRLPKAADKVLVMGDLVGSRNEGRRFTAAELQRAFMALHVPPPGNIAQTLSDLKRGGFTLSHGGGAWSLTPVGLERARATGAEASATVSSASAASSPGAEFAHVEHTVIPAWAAPPRWQVGIARLLA